MAIFSFRAEFQHDVDAFLIESRNLNIHYKAVNVRHEFLNVEPEPPYPATERSVEVDTFNPEVDLEMMRIIARRVPEAHHILETLRPVPLAQNSLERDNIV
jgi:hypothetical protein